MTILPKRSGGHEHPDFPFLGYYKHKRLISPTENHLWVYDGMNPEYLVDILAPQYTFGHILSRNLMLCWILPLALGTVLSTIIYGNFKRPYYSKVVKNNKNEVRKYLLRVKDQSIFKDFKNPLKHMHTYTDEGWVQTIPATASKKYNL